MRFPARPAAVVSILLAVFSTLISTAARAQTVHGELVERGAGRPIAGALVVLLDAEGTRRGAALTDAQGRFDLRAPRAGTYRLRAERVGFRSTTSPPLVLAPGVDPELAYRMEGDAAPVSLAGITARSGRRCRAHPGAGPATATLWEEVRKALAAAEHTARTGLLRYELETYERHLEPATRTVLHDERTRHAGEWIAPFFSTPVDSLSREGFVRVAGDSVIFDAPDAPTLLSDRFLADHCFRVEEDAERPGLVGLAFEPVAERGGVREVAGTLWLERGTARLRFLEYRYVNVPREISSAGAGGAVEFEALPGGPWIVRRWWIRMPQYEKMGQLARSSGEPALLAGGRNRRADGPIRGKPTRLTGTEEAHRLAWIREEGGEVVAAGGVAEVAPRIGWVAGTAWDSLNARPLAGARVFLRGTRWEAVADSAGRFVIDDVPVGRYAASFAHPELARWGTEPETDTIEVVAGEESALDFASPSLATLAARACAPPSLRDHPGVILGVVTRAGRALPRTGVKLTWRRVAMRMGRLSDLGLPSAGTVTDDHGFFVVCGVPVDAALDLEAKTGDAVFRERIHLEGVRIVRRDVRMEASTFRDAVTERSP